jgi:hypothetical protein
MTQEPWDGMKREERGGFIEANKDLDIGPEEDVYDDIVRHATKNLRHDLDGKNGERGDMETWGTRGTFKRGRWKNRQV